MADPDLARLVDEHDVRAISALPRDAVDAYLEQLVGELGRDPRGLDADRLVSLGNTLHLAGRTGADRTLAATLAGRPTEQALDAVSLVLSGLWRASVDPSALDALVTAAQALGELGADAAHSYRTALAAARRAAALVGDAPTAARAAALLD